MTLFKKAQILVFIAAISMACNYSTQDCKPMSLKTFCIFNGGRARTVICLGYSKKCQNKHDFIELTNKYCDTIPGELKPVDIWFLPPKCLDEDIDFRMIEKYVHENAIAHAAFDAKREGGSFKIYMSSFVLLDTL